MEGWIAAIIVISAFIYLLIQYCKNRKIDKTELRLYQEQLRETIHNKDKAELELKEAKDATAYERYKLDECRKDLQAALDVYDDMVNNRMQELDTIIDNQRQQRQEQLDQTFQEKQAVYESQLQNTLRECEEQSELVKDALAEVIEECMVKAQEATEQAQFQQQKYKSLIAPIKQYEMEKQERLFYTIQLPEEYHEDIEFLLTTVAEKVQHPDIISKLVWNEYVKNYLTDTCKRVGIREEPGIYKLTSLINGKSYIGKSTNVKKRIQDHFKSVVGIQSIADQAVHHAIRKEGFWNWTIEVIIYCDKEQLNELEKFYISTFETQEYGWNRNSGGGG